MVTRIYACALETVTRIGFTCTTCAYTKHALIHSTWAYAYGMNVLRGCCKYIYMSSLQYIGYTLIATPTLSLVRAREVVEKVVKDGVKHNKRKVTLTFAENTIYVSDMWYRVSHCETVHYVI